MTTSLLCPVHFNTYEELTAWLNKIDHLDERGFQKGQPDYWNKETPEKELERLESNQAFYLEYLKCGSRFPAEVKNQREAEFHRIRVLRAMQVNR